MKLRKVIDFLLLTFAAIGSVLFTFGFPIEALRHMRVFDVSILFLSIIAIIVWYGRKKHISGYEKGYTEAFLTRKSVGALGIEPRTSTL